MGYFSNGSEAADYEVLWCNRCCHQDDPCAVWTAHLLHNYDECHNDQSILHELIPRAPDGLSNGPCLMFIPKAEA